MKITRSPVAMQRSALSLKKRGVAIGFVPTMGFLHPGHLSLVSRARNKVGKDGVVVLSLFVNPTQFAPTEDLARYPRDFKRDKDLCTTAGVDILFVPSAESMYCADSGKEHSTWVTEEILSSSMEGKTRPTHFRGVATVVAKLFNLVLPDVAVFGAKDYQQAAVVKRLIRDLAFPIRLIVEPTLREADGLAMSSRNKYLTPEERGEATLLIKMIRAARFHVRSATGRGLQPDALKQVLLKLIPFGSKARVDYIEFFHPESLSSVSEVKRGTHMALAIFFGSTRLIDNGRL